MRIHFVAIGGSAMHNLALALHSKGYHISGSDDHIFEPSHSRLKAKGLLPQHMGWHPDAITTDLDAVILGMHAKQDNPELLKAQELNLPVFSYPEYIFEQSKDKLRIVIGGSHGKTSITSMIMHVLKSLKIDFDYLVGALLDGFETMVRISDAKIIVIEGDEYPASALQPYPKFHFYKANIAVISGIAWDHINVFKTFEDYKKQFSIFLDTIEHNGTLIYSKDDTELNNLVQHHHFLNQTEIIPYQEPSFEIVQHQTFIKECGQNFPLHIFGKHNLLNIQAAKNVCLKLGVSEIDFWNAMGSFSGASKRLEVWKRGDNFCIFKDFAHAPSKIRASIKAVKEQYPKRKLISCLELHTFSSLDKTFLTEYKNTTHESDIFVVYINKEVIKQKGINSFTSKEMKIFFNRKDLLFFEEKDELAKYLLSIDLEHSNILMMSSGIFGGLELNEFAE